MADRPFDTRSSRARFFARRALPALLVSGSLAAVALAAKLVGFWPLAGQNIANTRAQATESVITAANVSTLAMKWSLVTEGDISATPALDDDHAYFPDWKGKLYAVERQTGELKWQTSIDAITGVPLVDQAGGPGGVVRATPAIAGNLLIMGDQGGRVGAGAKVFAVNRKTGASVWTTQIQGNGVDNDSSFGAQFAIVTQSPVIDPSNPTVVYVATASWEEAMSAFIPGYPCCSFRGMVAALSTATGAVLWRTYMVPSIPGYSGNGVWGSTGTLDPGRRTLYVTTGNNYSVPADVASCVAAATTDAAKLACMAPTNYFDAIVAIDIQNGAVRWVTKALPYDTWNVNCIDIPGIGNPDLCPTPEGPDYDFAQGPSLFSARINNRNRDLIGAGQKSGMYWTLDRDTGAVVWSTQVGPGGLMGGLQWGSAVDDRRIYVALNNSGGVSWTPVGHKSPTTGGAWAALDKATGQILWQTVTTDGIPTLGSALGAVSVANGVVFGCSFGGTYTALRATNGAVLWTHNSNQPCAAGAAIGDGTVYWGTGYGQIMFAPTGPGRFFAFSRP